MSGEYNNSCRNQNADKTKATVHPWQNEGGGALIDFLHLKADYYVLENTLTPAPTATPIVNPTSTPIVLPTATPEPLRVCKYWGFAPFSLRKRIFARLAWKSSKLEQEEISTNLP